MKRLTCLILGISLLACGDAFALNYTQLKTVSLLRTEKRFEEALRKLETLATNAADENENFHYVNIAIEIATDDLKSESRALALAETIEGAAFREYARLQILSEFKHYDEALAWVKDKSIDAWPARYRGSAHVILARIYEEQENDAAAQEQRLLAIDSVGASASVRGNAANAAGKHYLKQGDEKGAMELFRQALEISPASYAWRTDSQMALSKLLVDSGRADEAVSLFEGMEFSKVQSPHTRGRLFEAYARALLASGRVIKAVETFDELLKTNVSQEWKDRINRELDEMAENF